MSESLQQLRHKIGSATELHAVVRTMKALAAANIGQYEAAVRALEDYYHTVELGLVASLRQLVQQEAGADSVVTPRTGKGVVLAIVFGSDQGLVGQFNETLALLLTQWLARMPALPLVWVVGERMQMQMDELELAPSELFTLPNSVTGITPLIGQLVAACVTHGLMEGRGQLYLFHNKPLTHATYEPVCEQVMPLDAVWQQRLACEPWPGDCLPQVLAAPRDTLAVLSREYLFVSLFRACAESQASENASRLVAMQRAEKNIEQLLSGFELAFHHLRQNTIDEELFDLISGFESTSGIKGKG